jgi:transcriptional regulator with XRE-family HTH domain
MLDLSTIGDMIKHRRQAKRLTQGSLARQAGVGRATVETLENGRCGELGFVKLSRLLAALGLEFKIGTANLGRPTLDDLLAENQADDQNMGR